MSSERVTLNLWISVIDCRQGFYFQWLTGARKILQLVVDLLIVE
jgi:hypothetical protein